MSASSFGGGDYFVYHFCYSSLAELEEEEIKNQ